MISRSWIDEPGLRRAIAQEPRQAAVGWSGAGRGHRHRHVLGANAVSARWGTSFSTKQSHFNNIRRKPQRIMSDIPWEGDSIPVNKDNGKFTREMPSIRLSFQCQFLLPWGRTGSQWVSSARWKFSAHGKGNRMWQFTFPYVRYQSLLHGKKKVKNMKQKTCENVVFANYPTVYKIALHILAWPAVLEQRDLSELY